MKKRQWTAQQKLQIVLEGMSGKTPVSELCNRHQIVQSQYYKWRDSLMQNGSKIFEGQADKQVDRLKTENRKLKTMIGELTVELKKTEFELAWLE